MHICILSCNSLSHVCRSVIFIVYVVAYSTSSKSMSRKSQSNSLGSSGRKTSRSSTGSESNEDQVKTPLPIATDATCVAGVETPVR